MGFARVDGYLLGDPVSKRDAVAQLLADRSSEPAAEPFYRALEAVGVRAADEALLALRLVLARRTADDAAVRRLRAFASLARACARDDARSIATILERDAAVVPELTQTASADLAIAARAAYARELA